MDSYNTARLCDFQICRRHGRVIDKIERFYRIDNDLKGKKERITLSDVLSVLQLRGIYKVIIMMIFVRNT